MRPKWPRTLFLVLLAGCGLKSPAKAPPAASILAAPVVQQITPALPTVAAPVPQTPTAEDIAYLRWLIQFETAAQQIAARQDHDLPSAFGERDQNRLRALLKSWQDSRQELSQLNNQAAMADQFVRQLQQMQFQFQSRTAPPNCQSAAAGYAQVLARRAERQQFNARLYREFARILQNPRAASALLPADLRDGGAAIDTRLKQEKQNAGDATNAALSQFTARFAGQVPRDVAAFHIP